jgi:hypothetical protein
VKLEAFTVAGSSEREKVARGFTAALMPVAPSVGKVEVTCGGTAS